jgi:NADP-dependent 3-hydroxy acid dehydrogenase YdfG
MKTALITGTSSGLGECLALALLKSGWKVIGLSRRENKQLTSFDNFYQIQLDICDKNKVADSLSSLEKIDCVLIMLRASS